MRINAGLILEANVPESKALMNIYKVNVCQLIWGIQCNDIHQKLCKFVLLSHNSELRIQYHFMIMVKRKEIHNWLAYRSSEICWFDLKNKLIRHTFDKSTRRDTVAWPWGVIYIYCIGYTHTQYIYHTCSAGKWSFCKSESHGTFIRSWTIWDECESCGLLDF